MRRLLVALALLVTIGAPQAFAVNVPLDDFTLAQSLILFESTAGCPGCSDSDTVANDGSFYSGFDDRYMFLYFNTADSTGLTASVSSEVVPTTEKFTYSSTDGEDGYAYLEYTGTGTDLSSFSQFAFTIQNDIASSFMILVEDGSGGSFEITQSLAALTDQTYFFALSDFTGVDFTDVVKVRLYIDGIAAFNLDANVLNPPTQEGAEPYTLTMLGLGAILLGRRLSKRS